MSDVLRPSLRCLKVTSFTLARVNESLQVISKISTQEGLEIHTYRISERNIHVRINQSAKVISNNGNLLKDCSKTSAYKK